MAILASPNYDKTGAILLVSGNLLPVNVMLDQDFTVEPQQNTGGGGGGDSGAVGYAS